MSEKSQKIIKYFCDRFLELDYYPKSIKAILDLTIEKLKDVQDGEVNELQKKKLKQIRDISDLELDNFKDLTENLDIEEKTINNIYIASNLIANAWNKRKAYLKKPQMKVVIAGLDFAGKTTLIKRLIHNRNYYDLVNLEPTKGANVEEFQSDKLNLVLWDLGGQKAHIDEYLQDPERYFIKVDLLIFVIDSQDDVRYDDAIKYLKDLLNILEYLDENPYFLVLLNKADSDIIDDPDFQIKLEYLKDEVSTVFKERENAWNVEIIPTSVFNVHSNEPEIATSIKQIFAKEPEQEPDKKIPEINEKLQKILDINLNFMNNIVAELNDMKKLLIRISPAKVSKSLYGVPFQEMITDSEAEKTPKSKQRNLTKEVSKPLELGEVLGAREKKEEKKGKKKEKSLPTETPEITPKPETDPEDKKPSKIPSKTPPSPQDTKDLHPPPSPPKSSGQKKQKTPIRPPQAKNRQNKAHVRGQMLSELKDLFVKRGIANMGVTEKKKPQTTDVKVPQKQKEGPDA